MKEYDARVEIVGCDHYKDGLSFVCTIFDDKKGRFKNGVQIRTSKVIEMDIPNQLIKTLNSVYYYGQ